MTSVLLANGPASPAIKTSSPKLRPLIVYSPHGPAMLSAAKAAFHAKYPDVALDWHYQGTNDLYQSLLTEKDKPKADVWWGGSHFLFAKAKRDKLLRAYIPSWSKNISSGHRDSEHFWYGESQTPLTIIYNRQTINRADIPQDWDDLLAPKYFGKIILREPLGSGSMLTLFSVFIDRQLRLGLSEEAAINWLLQLTNNVGPYLGHSQIMFHSLGTGLGQISMWNAAETEQRKNQGFPIEVIFPKSGMPVLLDGIALVARQDPHPYADEFFEVVTSLEFASAMASDPANRIPVRTDVARNLRPAYMKDKRFKEMFVDWERISNRTEQWINKWYKLEKAHKKNGAKP